MRINQQSVHPYRKHNTNVLIAELLAGVMLFTSILSAASPLQEGLTTQAISKQPISLASLPNPGDILAFESPKFGHSVSGENITVKLRVGKNVDIPTLSVRLNGQEISSNFTLGNCNDAACDDTATVTSANGLRMGQNRMNLAAHTNHGSSKIAYVRFDHSSGMLGDAEDSAPAPYIPDSLGFQLLNSGGFVSITTGTPAALKDASDTTKYSLPVPDTVFPLSTETACSTKYQVLELDRKNPTSEKLYSCYDDPSSLASHLSGLEAGSEIVVVGTTGRLVADANLDTSSIGGTNYAKVFPTSPLPLEYAVIGVPGATPGSAYESFNSGSDKPYGNLPVALGSLNLDLKGNYNFLPGDNRPFTVSPNDATVGTSYVQVGSQIHKAPKGATNGFWLLQLEAVGQVLQPVDSDGSNSSCQYLAPVTQGCGQFFATGSGDPDESYLAMASLAQALAQVSPRSLAFLTTVGSPFGAPVSGNLPAAVSEVGGAGYTLTKLGHNDAYTLVFRGVDHLLQTTRTPFTSGIVLSSSAYSQYGQTGWVSGYLGRGQDSAYLPIASAQQGSATNMTPDLALTGILGNTPSDWPLTDTPGHIAAYHYLSSQFLSAHYTETGSHLQDIRYFYTDGDKADMGADNIEFIGPNYHYNFPGLGKGFTLADYTAANDQLYLELTALKNVNGYLGAEQGIGSVYTSSVAENAIEVAGNVLSGQASPSTLVALSMNDTTNLISSAASVGSVIFGTLGVPEGGALLGALSAMVKFGGATASIADDKTTPASYMNKFDTTLANLTANYQQYAQNMIAGYSYSFNMIMCDWGKMQPISDKIADSDAHWSFGNKIAQSYMLANVLKVGMENSMYAQLLPTVYKLDTFTATPISSAAGISKIGSYTLTSNPGTVTEYCSAVPSYNNLAATVGSYNIYPSPSLTPGWDFLAMGGTLVVDNGLNGDQTITEAMPTGDLLNTLFKMPAYGTTLDTTSVNLNIPQDYIYGSNLLTHRSVSNNGLGYTPCYAAPCTHGHIGGQGAAACMGN